MTCLKSERGQTTAEYMGVLVVVGLVIAAVVGSGIASTVGGAIERAVCEVASGPGACESSTEQRAGDSAGDRASSDERALGEQPSIDFPPPGPPPDGQEAGVASLPAGRTLTTRPAIATGGAQTCFASTRDPCQPRAPGGAYEFAPPQPTSGEQIDDFLGDAVDEANAWLGWLGGSDPSSPFYDPMAEQQRQHSLQTLDDGLALLEDLNRGHSALGAAGPLQGGDSNLGNELLGLSDLRRGVQAAQDNRSLQALGFLAMASPFGRAGRAGEQVANQATKAGSAAVRPIPGGNRRIQALRNIGEKGAGRNVREVPGGLERAEEIYPALARGAQPYRTLPDGRQLLQRTDGTIIGLRAQSRSGSPSIDVRPPGEGQYFQLKFTGGR